MGLSRLIHCPKMAILMALTVFVGFAGPLRVQAFNGPHHGGGHMGGGGHVGPMGGFAGGGHFGGSPGYMAPTWGSVFSSGINGPNNWGSVFSSGINGPNNWGRVLSSGLGNPTPYYGGYPGYGNGYGYGYRPGFGGWYNNGSVLAMPGYGYGVIPGLAVVSPGWAGYPYWGNFGYGFGYPYWGYSNYFVNTGFWPNNGFGWGWNNGGWNGFNNGMAVNWGLLASINEILQRGNARFGPARPVKQVAARNRKGKALEKNDPNAIAMPAAADGNGLNSVAPAPLMNAQRKPMDPLKPEEPTVVAIPPPADNQIRMAMAIRPDGRIIEPTIRPKAKQAPLPRSAPGEGPKPKALFPDAATIAQREQWVMDRLQGGDRLARNGLYAEAREKYRALAATMADQPAPWLRLAQLETLAGNAEAARSAWNEAVRRETATEPGYSKRFTWSRIADVNAVHLASARLAEWTAKPEFELLKGLKATLPEPVAASLEPFAMR